MADAWPDSHAKADSACDRAWKLELFLSQFIISGIHLMKTLNCHHLLKTWSTHAFQIKHRQRYTWTPRYAIGKEYDKAPGVLPLAECNVEIWQRDPDPLVSAAKLLTEEKYKSNYHSVILTSGNLRALAFFAIQTTTKLLKSTSQLVMDSTFETNNGGLDLFADERFPSYCLPLELY